MTRDDYAQLKIQEKNKRARLAGSFSKTFADQTAKQREIDDLNRKLADSQKSQDDLIRALDDAQRLNDKSQKAVEDNQ